MNFQELLNKKLADSAFKKSWDEDEILYTIVLNLITLRDELDLSIEEIAKRADVDYDTVYDLFMADIDISILTLDKIAKALNTTVSDITKRH